MIMEELLVIIILSIAINVMASLVNTHKNMKTLIIVNIKMILICF